MDRTLSEREILLREYDNAWLHNRHLETLRSQYVGFYLTFLTATVALGGARASGAYNSPAKATELSLLLMSMSVVTWFVSVSLRRWGVVIRHYDLVIYNIRRLGLSVPSRALIRMKPRTSIGIQQASEVTLLAAHLAILASAIVLLVRVIALDRILRYLCPTVVSVLVTGVSAVIGANWNVIFGEKGPDEREHVRGVVLPTVAKRDVAKANPPAEWLRRIRGARR